MALSDIKTRQPIVDAIAEFDHAGRDRFLQKYGFGPSRSYELVHDGKRYDSKAIVGAAHGYARPDLGPLPAATFSGGEETVKRKLESLDFVVERKAETRLRDDNIRKTSAFLLTWKESGWPHSNILRMFRIYQEQGFVEEDWRFHAHRQAKSGDRVWLLKQGAGPKGIFGVGKILAPARRGDAGNGKQQMMVRVRFSVFSDPKQQLLIDEPATRGVLSATQIRMQASGYPLSDDQSESLEIFLADRIRSFPLIRSHQADNDPFDPSTIEDARARIRRTIAQRRGQRAFRDFPDRGLRWKMRY
jgi:hypothetical protein